MSDLPLNEIRARKKALEKALLKAIAAEVATFRAATGVDLMSIHVRFVEQQFVGELYPRRIIAGVTVSAGEI